MQNFIKESGILSTFRQYKVAVIDDRITRFVHVHVPICSNILQSIVLRYVYYRMKCVEQIETCWSMRHKQTYNA